MSAATIEVQPTTTKYQIRSNVPIPPSGRLKPRFKNPALIAAVDSMRVGDCLSSIEGSEKAQAVMRLFTLYGKGSATQRQHTDGTYTVWRVK